MSSATQTYTKIALVDTEDAEDFGEEQEVAVA
jgi:hypothetical protein